MIQSVRKTIAKIFGTERTVIAWGRFTTAGTGAPTVNEAQGVSSIARAGVGVYTITLPYTWKELTVIPVYSASNDSGHFVETARSASAKTITITAYAAGTATATEQNGPACGFVIVARL